MTNFFRPIVKYVLKEILTSDKLKSAILSALKAEAEKLQANATKDGSSIQSAEAAAVAAVAAGVEAGWDVAVQAAVATF